jgi:integrase
MSALADHVEEYLAMRRALGFKLEFPGHVLPQFAAFLDAAGVETVTIEAAIAWAGLRQGSVQPISLAHRLGAVRGFARWLQTIDPAAEVPPAGIWPSTAPRLEPYLWADAEIRALLDAAGRLTPPLRAATHQTLFGLLAATGMRIGQAAGLARHDVDLGDGVIMIRDAKFDRERIVPMHPSTADALRAYAEHRDQLCPEPRSATFFISTVGTRIRTAGLQRTFRELTRTIGLCNGSVRPRAHDLRHSFAVSTLLDWHRAGVDVAARMTVLSNYLGHVSAAGTFWYLSAAPELMELVAARLQDGDGNGDRR